MKIYYFESNIRPVTSFYLDIIIEALSNCGFQAVPFKDLGSKHLWELPRKETFFLTTGHKDITHLRILGFKNFIHWFQGLTAEEDYMRTHSRLRKTAFNFLDNNSLRHSLFSFFVTDWQKDYLSKKFGISPQHYFIMPCFNDVLNQNHFFVENKYLNNTFCYVGSTTDAWQCFEQNVSLYKQIELKHNDCFFKIITPDIDHAKALASQYDLKNYNVKYVPQHEVSQEIADCKFGFIIRENDIVNNVATPTKLSDYLANGVIPIFSDSLLSYVNLAERHKFLYVINKENAMNVIEDCMETTYSPEELLKSYRDIFDCYYNRDFYVKSIETALRDAKLLQ